MCQLVTPGVLGFYSVVPHNITTVFLEGLTLQGRRFLLVLTDTDYASYVVSFVK